MSSALVSPVEPLISPNAKLEVCVLTWSNLKAANGVALEMPSNAGSIKGKAATEGMTLEKRSSKKAGYHVVMATGKAA